METTRIPTKLSPTRRGSETPPRSSGDGNKVLLSIVFETLTSPRPGPDHQGMETWSAIVWRILTRRVRHPVPPLRGWKLPHDDHGVEVGTHVRHPAPQGVAVTQSLRGWKQLNHRGRHVLLLELLSDTPPASAAARCLRCRCVRGQLRLDGCSGEIRVWLRFSKPFRRLSQLNAEARFESAVLS